MPGEGNSVTSPRSTVIRGCDDTRSCTRREKTSRSTASAAPAGTLASSAQARSRLPSARNSALSRPWALHEFGGLEGIAADQLGQPVRLMRRGRDHRAHLADDYGDATFGQGPGRFTPGEPSADHRHSGGFPRGWVAVHRTREPLGLGHVDPASSGSSTTSLC